MDMSFSPEDQAFRAEVRQFLRDRLPARLSEKVRLHQELTKDEIEEWHGVIGDATLADAILDRLVHNAYKINLRGESMRKQQAKLTGTETSE